MKFTKISSSGPVNPVNSGHLISVNMISFNFKVDHGTTLVSCGSGSVTPFAIIPPSGLQEILLKSSIFRSKSRSFFDPLETCPNNTICVTSQNPNSNLCYMDEGNPLYTIEFCDRPKPRWGLFPFPLWMTTIYN